ncbi:Probable protein transport Sec1b [Galdieria sulphuraria]|nr:Probable protein transport Sec1b [Galdieria sulphuraria]
MSELVSVGISLVEQLEAERTYLPTADAVYILNPSIRTAKLLKKESNANFKSFHILFVRHLQDSVFQQFQLPGAFINKVKTLKELYLDFIAREDMVFSLERPSASILQIYNKGREAREEEISLVADRLVTLLYSFGFEEVQYRYPSSSFLSKKLIFETSKRLKQLYEWAPKKKVIPPLEPTVFVLERPSDLVSVLLHEFTYQSMCYDLAPLDRSSCNGSTFQYEYSDAVGNKKKGHGILEDDNDPLWKKTRHQHIADAIKELDSELRAFASTNKAAQLQQSKCYQSSASESQDRSVMIKELNAALRSFPEYQERLSRYALHQELMSTCMREYQRRNLRKIAEVEQDIATGKTISGEKVKQREYVTTLSSLLADFSLEERDRIRLLLLVKYLSSEFRRFLLPYQTNTSSFSIFEIENFFKPYTTSSRNIIQGKKHLHHQKASKRYKRYIDGEVYELSRYSPPLKRLLIDFIEGCLSLEGYPSINSAQASNSNLNETQTARPRAGSVRHRRGSSTGINTRLEASTGDLTKEALSWSPKNYSQPFRINAGSTKDVCETLSQRKSIIVFFVGGVSFSEIRVAHEISAKFDVDIYIGGTSLLVPEDFLNIIAAYENDDLAMRLLYSGQEENNVPNETSKQEVAVDRASKKELPKERTPDKKTTSESRGNIFRSESKPKERSALLDPSIMFDKFRSLFKDK